MCFGSGTVDSRWMQRAPGRRCMCTLKQVAALFCVKWRRGKFYVLSKFRLWRSMHVNMHMQKNNQSNITF